MAANKNKRSNDIDLASYESLNFEALGRHPNYRIIAYREDMLHILDKKDAAAIIYQIIYRWLTEKRREDILSELEKRQKANQPALTPEEVEDRMWVYMSYNDFVRESGGAIGYNTVVRTLDYLINMKKVVERRANSNPKFTEYEYRINKDVVRDLLKILPTFPYYIGKGARGQDIPYDTPTHIGVPSPNPSGSDVPPQKGLGDTQKGLGDTQKGAPPTPKGATSQKQTQISSQESSQVITQQKQGVLPLTTEHPAATTHSEIGNLSSEEIALILVHRQQTTISPPLEETPPAETIQESDQASITPSVVAVPSAPAAAPACPAADAPLTDEIIVQVFEYKHGVRYDEELRPFQLQAARALLELAVPVSLGVNLLERVYDECYDEWWRSHYGDLDVSHLTEKERAGSRRIVRLIKRVQNRGQPLATNGHADEAGSTAQNLVEWNGRMIPKEQAYREGYNGGFERYREGEHEGDDLDAMVKKYQAQGLLPVLESAGGQ